MQKKVAAFEKKMGWDRTSAGQLALLLKKDAMVLNDMNAKHKLVDIYLETVQLANRNRISLDVELLKLLKAAEKKYPKVKK